DSIAGGGRFDKTVGKYLTHGIPAVGISFGLERVCQLAKIKVESLPKVLLISISQEAETIRLAKKLRKSGVSCSIEFGKVGKAMEYANALKIPYVVFVGEEEVGKKKYKLKNMESGKEEMVTEEKLVGKLGK
ncbi:MAG: hypothetical protein KKD94_05480, partial [Nanoarchaeota archaeon]|nr:hypothetical protein [Nanoarchaeota archaeon]